MIEKKTNIHKNNELSEFVQTEILLDMFKKMMDEREKERNIKRLMF